MAVYLGLGSNLGDRRQNLKQAIDALGRESIRIERVSPVVESPAMLPPGAPPEWNRPFLNLVVECRTGLSPADLLQAGKRVEAMLRREDPRRWSPRPIDIDILLYDDLVISSAELSVPHPGLADRAFVLTPLTALAPGLIVPGSGLTVLEQQTARGSRIPLWMGIVNLTPDSFSDGGLHERWDDVEATLERMLAAGVHYVDLGAESTRPGARALEPAEEWSRLEPILGRLMTRLRGDVLRPQVSIDTYHAEVAARAIDLGVDMINDVGGLTRPDMIALAAQSTVTFVAMHNLGLPADRSVTLPADCDPVLEVESWLDRNLARWSAANLDPCRLVFDPGIGFGKNALQSLRILRAIDRYTGKGLRLLVGHSRKSFMQDIAGASVADRDLVTIGASLALCRNGADILRVHDVPAHAMAWRGWAALEPAPRGAVDRAFSSPR